jgi:eukaryotic-like serine/threonine-protein kinase
MAASDVSKEGARVSAEPKTPEPDRSGQILDRYHLLRRLGVGGMGAVYEAEHTRLRKRFAVKLLRYEFAQSETFRKRFLREARAASAITHPNVVAISDFGDTPDGHVFFVMELLAGRDLQELLDSEKKLPWPRAREILLQVTSALHAAHVQDIIHRDIKPSNVFLADVPGKGDEDFVKVLDFGIAKLSGDIGQATAKLTSTDEIFGTVAYMAPEMAMGTNDDRRSDIYAVGVMMYRMLTGELPFTQGNAFQILSQHINAPLPPPRTKEPSIPAEVEAILQKALAKSPDDRLASMEVFGRALRRGSLEATEALVGLRTDLLVGQPKLPMDSPAATIDRTTPLPAHGAPIAPQQLTVVSSPIVLNPTDSAVPLGVGFGAPPPTVEPEPSNPKRSLLWLVIPALVIAGLAAAIIIAVLDAQRNEADQGTEEASVAPPQPSEPIDQPSAHEAPSVASKAPDEPEPSVPPVDPKPDEHAQPPPADEPSDEPPAQPVDPPTDTTQPPPQAKRSSPSKTSKPKPKPKTDQEVVAALKSKLLAKCKAQGTTKVKIEGMISSTGTVGSLLITPPDGLGACAKKIVTATKFDPTAGTRSMPRFSVEL